MTPSHEISLTEARLARHPWHTLFFSVFALFFYAMIVFGISGTLFPDVAAAARGEGDDAVLIGWRMQLVLQVVMLLHLTFWAEAVGAGPFGGTLRTSFRWLVGAAISAPFVYMLVLLFAFYVIGGGAADWAYRDEASAEAVSAAALGPIMVVSVLVLAPIVEEITFRGVAMGHLLGRGLNPHLAVVLPAAAFAMLHVQYTPAAIFSVFMLGLFLGWLRLKSGSIAPPIIAHMAVNLQVIVGLWASTP